MEKTIIIPTIKKGKFIKNENEGRIDCFYGFEDKADEAESMQAIQSEMSNYTSFKINYDFERRTKIESLSWSYIGNVMIYENNLATDATRIMIDGKGNYECILWMSAEIKS